MLPDIVDFFSYAIGQPVDISGWGKFFKQTGFPKGLAMSFATITQFAPGGFEIRAGISFTGRMTVMGWNGFLKLKLVTIGEEPQVIA